jgi:hypothetical protein
MSVPYSTVLLAVGLAGCATQNSIATQDSMQLLVRRTDPVPQEIKDAYAGRHLHGDYKITTDTTGRVTAVSVVRSIPDCDEMVINHLRHSYLFKRPSLLHVEIVFALPSAAGPNAPYRALPTESFDHLVTERAVPLVQDGVFGGGSYMVYVEPDGAVSRVDVVQSTGNADDVVKSTFMRWKFKPSGERIRGVLRLTVDFRPPR